jgi:DNA-binding MarR family transcriptional regulator
LSRPNLDASRAALTQELQRYQSTVDGLDQAAAERLGVSRTDLRCLEILIRDGTTSPGRLGPELGLTSGGVTAMLSRLERKGYLRRVRGTEDARRVQVAVTDDGRRLTMALYGPVAVEGADVVVPYSIEELRLITDFLRSAREFTQRQLDRVRGEEDGGAVPDST